ncbi:MAG: hypothetical protein JOZ96_24070 [Acidobacteria bacterium]|nr:hypothetical protein [Acidobacteriota bacterium]
MQKKAKVLFAALTLCLALAQGCDQVGDNRSATVAVSPTPAAPGPATAATPAPAAGQSDACRLLTSEDIQAVQGEVLKEAKGTRQADGPLLVEQCLYATTSYNKSVSLTLTRRNAASPAAGDPKEFWRERFGGEKEREKGEGKKETDRPRGEHAPERRGEEKEEGERPALPVKGVGDQAYWAGNDKTGVLYVLKGDSFLRVSVGGPEGQQAKIEKMKELARRALKRL